MQQGIKGLKYTMRELRRTAHWRTRDDSIVTFVKSDRIVIQDAKNILFHDAGDRVALLLLLGLRSGGSAEAAAAGVETAAPLQQFICINTHLLFPHNEFSTKIRMREITKILVCPGILVLSPLWFIYSFIYSCGEYSYWSVLRYDDNCLNGFLFIRALWSPTSKTTSARAPVIVQTFGCR